MAFHKDFLFKELLTVCRVKIFGYDISITIDITSCIAGIGIPNHCVSTHIILLPEST